MAKERLDKLLVDRGLAPSRERARALILAGKVRVAGQSVDKAGAQVATTVEVELIEPDHPYVSRGALKLVKGLDAFGIDPAGMVALDIGASTGGFTDVLLRRGAARVYAIDVGYGQLAWSLRQDPRVVVLERHNVRAMDLALVPEPADLAVIDVSFISLTLVLPRIVELMGPPAGKSIVALIKPQFEVGRELVGKGGVVRDEAARQGAIDKVRAWAEARGFAVSEAVESPIRGPAGNVEYLVRLGTPEVAPETEPEPEAESGTGTGTGAGSEPESGTGTGTGTGSEPEAGTGTGTGTGSEPETGTGTGTGTGPEPEADTDSGAQRVRTQ